MALCLKNTNSAIDATSKPKERRPKAMNYNELTLEEHTILRKHPKELHEKVYIYRNDIEEYYMFYIYPSYIKLIGKNNAVKLFHIYYGSTLQRDIQEAMKQATGLRILQRDIKQRLYNGKATQRDNRDAINKQRNIAA